MRQPIRSGKARIPADWRRQIGLPRWRRKAFIALTGVHTRDEAIVLLAAHLPLIPADPDEAEAGNWDYEYDETPDDVDELDGEDGFEDADSARRIGRSLSARRHAPGVEALLAARVISPHRTAVYAWRSAGDGEAAYRLWPDGATRAVAVFNETKVPSLDGRPPRTRLTAHRYT
jgi:hypothetical protein